MPLQTETVDLAAEVDRLESEMADIAEEHANWEGVQSGAMHLLQEGNDLDRYISAVEYLQEHYDCDSVTFQGLTAGDRNVAMDAANDHDNLKQAADVAVGTRDAPWLSHDPERPGEDIEDVKDTMMNIHDLPPGVVDWADERIGDLTHLREKSGNGYMELLVANLNTSETPENENG